MGRLGVQESEVIKEILFGFTGSFAAEGLLLPFLEFFGGVGEIFSPIAVRAHAGYRVNLDG